MAFEKPVRNWHQYFVKFGRNSMTCTEAREMWKTMGKSEQTQWRTKAEDYNKKINDSENAAADEADHDGGPEELEGVETEAVEVDPGDGF